MEDAAVRRAAFSPMAWAGQPEITPWDPGREYFLCVVDWEGHVSVSALKSKLGAPPDLFWPCPDEPVFWGGTKSADLRKVRARRRSRRITVPVWHENYTAGINPVAL